MGLCGVKGGREERKEGKKEGMGLGSSTLCRRQERYKLGISKVNEAPHGTTAVKEQ